MATAYEMVKNTINAYLTKNSEMYPKIEIKWELHWKNSSVTLSGCGGWRAAYKNRLPGLAERLASTSQTKCMEEPRA